MPQIATDLAEPWTIEPADADSYAFTNLGDYAAWGVVVHSDSGEVTTVPGHVGYARGSFVQALRPGKYWLSWDITLSLLPHRDGHPAPPHRRTSMFDVPLADPVRPIRIGTN